MRILRLHADFRAVAGRSARASAGAGVSTYTVAPHYAAVTNAPEDRVYVASDTADYITEIHTTIA